MMTHNDNGDLALENLLTEGLSSEIPPEVEARLRRHLAAFREKLESSEAQERPG